MTTETFVEQLYTNFFFRSSDTGGKQYWVGILDQGILDASQVSQVFVQSAEAEAVVSPLIELYYAAFGGILDTAILISWITDLQNGASLQDIRASVVTSAEFQTTFDSSLSNEGFLAQLYQTAFGREGDAGGVTYWLGQMDNGLSRGDLLGIFSASQELSAARSGEVDVVARYLGTLNRVPTRSEIDAATPISDPVGLITSLYASADYTGEAIPGLSTQGVVIDGYISGANVFIDANGNGVLDDGETSTTTDEFGNFDFGSNAGFGPLIMSGGTDISTGKPFEGRMTAPGGSSVVNPLTTLVDLIASDPNISNQQATAMVKAAMGLDPDVDLLNYDPVAETLRTDTSAEAIAIAVAVQSKMVQVNILLSQTAAVLAGSGASATESDAITSGFQALADVIVSAQDVAQGVTDISSGEIVKAVIQAASTSAGADATAQAAVDAVIDDASQTISNLNSAVESEVGKGGTGLDVLSRLAAVQIVAEDIEDDLLAGAAAGDVSGTVGGTSGSSFDSAFEAAGLVVGDVDGAGTDDPDTTDGTGGGGGGGGPTTPTAPTATPVVNIDLTDLTAAQGFIVQGDAANDKAGFSVSSAGDINGDGFDDLIVGAYTGDDGGDRAGEAYVVFGSGSGFGTDVSGRQVLDLSNLSAAQGFIIQGDVANDRAGRSVSSAGDINGDGFDDLIVGARYGYDGGGRAGEAYVVFGSGSGFGTDVSGRQVIDLSNLTSSQGFIIQGDALGDRAGTSVSSAGDINGDGFDDLIVGANFGDDGGTYAGEAYVIFGSGSTFGTDVSGRQVIDLSNLTSSQGFIIQGDEVGDLAGRSVSSAGDINGDGFDDLIVGAYGGDDGGENAGEVYVVFGSGSGFGMEVSGRQVIDLSSLSAAQGFIIQGNESNDFAGLSVSSAGDINGDGFDDLIVGAVGGDDGGTQAGEAYVVFGSGSGFGTDVSGRQVIDLSFLTSSQGFIIQGDEAGDFAGRSVSSAGDINGDGFDDLIVGAADGGDGGEAYVIFGANFGAGASVTTTGTASAEILLGSSSDDVLTGAGGADIFRAGAGDDIIAISDTTFARIDGGTGADILRLDGSGITLDLTTILPSIITDIETIDLTGSGDNSLTLNVSDVFDITTTRSDGKAIVYVTGNAGDSVSFADGGDWTNAGLTTVNTVTFVRYTNGNAEVRVQDGVVLSALVTNIDLTDLTAAQGFIIQGDDAGDEAGFSVSSAGDINGDGFDDFIVGAFLGGDGGNNAGEAYVIFGSGSDFGTDVSGRQVIDLSFLTSSQGFIIQGDAAGDLTGFSVSSAGDINGDGFDDLIVGAHDGDDGGEGAGEAYVVFGSGSAFGTAVSGRQVIDLSTLSAAQGFIIRGDAAFDYAGRSVSSAGDINGDGFDDFIVGASRGDDGGNTAGEAYVVFGSGSDFGTDVSGRQVIDLTTLSAAQGFIIQGDAADDYAGASVSSAGDINGDGFDDLIVGANLSVFHGFDDGEAYVVFGSSSAFGTDVSDRQVIDLETLSKAQGFIIALDEAGRGVSSAGDINGDGFDDLIVGASYADGGGHYRAGEAYVVFGSGSDFGTDVSDRQVIDMSTLTSSQGFIIQGDATGDFAGHSVSSAGDINGDGFDDLIVGAQYGDDGDSNAGEAYVIFGSGSGFGTDVSGRQVIDLSNLSAVQGFIIQGDAADDHAGFSVSSAGDINGDGFDDLIVGAKYGDDGDSNAGEAYVIFGANFGAGAAVTTTGTASAEILLGSSSDDVLTGAGGADIFRTGAGDDIIGISDTTFARIDGGTGADILRLDGSGITLDLTAVLPSIITDIETIDLTGSGDNSLTLNVSDVFDITTTRSGGKAIVYVTGNAGDSVSFADGGDWTGAGSTVVNAVTFNHYTNGNAEVRVQDGVVLSALVTNIDLTDLTAAQGFIIQGDAVIDGAGHSVSSAGDINGDGFDDLIVGVPNGDDGGSYAGEAYVVFGSGSGFGTDDGGRQVIDLSNLSAAQGFIIQGDVTGDSAGSRVSSAGDINGDGFDDLIVGADLGADGGNNAGEAYVIFGSGSTFGTADGASRQVIDLTDLSAAQGFIIQGDAADDGAGRGVSSAGDINGDGFDDLIVGARRGDDGGTDVGEAYVIFGSGSTFGTDDGGGRQVIDLSALTSSQGFIIQGDAVDDGTGSSVSSAGDINGDGFDDFIVGVYRGDDGGVDAGEIYVIFGSDSTFGTDVGGRQVIDLTNLSAAQGFIIQGDEASDRAGNSVWSAGDINGDGFDDVIVGAYQGDDGGTRAGEAYVIFGSGSTFGADDGGGRQVIDLSTLSAAQGFIIQGDEERDYAGRSVSSAGDINGDGFDDLIVGANGGDDGGSNAGEAYVVFGSGSGFGINVSGRQVIDLSNLTNSQGFIIQGDEAADRAGISVSSAGDINGDGFDDLIVGADRGGDGGNIAGEAYVIFGAAFGAGSAVTTTGTAGAEILRGSLVDDVLTGAGGADIFRAGAGDDIVAISDTTFARIDGGTGADVLRLDGSGISLDLTAVLPSIITDIETIDLTGSGDNSLTLNISDVFDITTTRSDGKAIVYVTGNAGDSVSFADGGWTRVGSTVVNSITFNQYANGNAELRIQDGVTSNVAGDPIVLDLGGDGFSFAGAVAFDLNADGVVETLSAWVGGEDGLLVIDLDGSGAIENGSEVISPWLGAGGYFDSLEALASLDDNADNRLDGADQSFASLQVWRDANSNGISEAGELSFLGDLGIVSIDLVTQAQHGDVDGVHIYAQGVVTLVSGETRDFVEVGFTQIDELFW